MRERTAPAATKLQRVYPKRHLDFGRHLAFAVDDEAIQMAAASQVGFRVHLLNVLKSYFPPGLDPESGRQNFLLGEITEFVQKHGGRHPTISVTLTGPETALRTVVMPELKSRELRTAVKFEGKRQIPFPIEDCRFDHRAMEKITTGRQQRLKISILAATKRLVQERLAPFDELGLEVSYVYHAHDVIGQLLQALPEFEAESNYALINIRRQHFEISYYHGCNLDFSHVGSIGSSFLANRSDPTAFEYFAESLAGEIQNSLDYYSGQHSSHYSNQIFVYGDLAYTDELIDLLSDRFGFSFSRFPAEVLSFVQGRRLPFEESLPIGLPVVAAVTNRVKLANLLPEDRKVRRKRRRFDRLSVAALIVLAGLLISQWLSAAASTRAAQEELGKLQTQLTELKATEMYITYNRLRREVTSTQSFIDKARETPSYLGLNLKELSNLTPQAVRLYGLDYQSDVSKGNFQVLGLVTATSTPPELILAEYVENLAASPFYEDVIVERHAKRRVPEGFELDFRLNMKAVT